MEHLKKLRLSARRLYFLVFKRYRRLELRILTFPEADELCRSWNGVDPKGKWHVADEDQKMLWPNVALERKERITE